MLALSAIATAWAPTSRPRAASRPLAASSTRPELETLRAPELEEVFAARGSAPRLDQDDGGGGAAAQLQALVASAWARLSGDDALAYLDEASRARVKSALLGACAHAALDAPHAAATPRAAVARAVLRAVSSLNGAEIDDGASAAAVAVHPLDAAAAADAVAAQAAAEDADSFAAMDADGDGVVTRDEYERFLRSQLGAAGDGAERVVAEIVTAEQTFAMMDSDGDGFVTESEFSAHVAAEGVAGAAWARFARWFAAESAAAAAASGAAASARAAVAPRAAALEATEPALERVARCVEAAHVLVAMEADAETVSSALALELVAAAAPRALGVATRERDIGDEAAAACLGGDAVAIAREWERMSVLLRSPHDAMLAVDDSDAGGRVGAEDDAHRALLAAVSQGVPAGDLGDTTAARVRRPLVRSVREPRALLVLLATATATLRRLADHAPVAAGAPPPVQPPARTSNAPPPPTAASLAALATAHSTALEALQVHVPIAEALGIGARTRELEERAYAALFPDTYARTRERWARLSARACAVMPLARRELLVALEREFAAHGFEVSFEVGGRVKELTSALRKMFRGVKQWEQVLDAVGMRIVVTRAALATSSVPLLAAASDDDDDDDAAAAAAAVLASCAPPREAFEDDGVLLRRVHSIVTGLWPEVPGRFKDYVGARAKPSGYQSVHTTVQHPSGLVLEVQIRTDAMHEFAQMSHLLYKASGTPALPPASPDSEARLLPAAPPRLLGASPPAADRSASSDS